MVNKISYTMTHFNPHIRSVQIASLIIVAVLYLQPLNLSAQVDISGPDTVCNYDQTTYTAKAPNGAAYDWTITGAGYPMPDGDELDVDWFSPGSATISVEVKDQQGQIIGYDNIEVEVLPAPTPEIEPSFNSECGEVIVVDTNIGYERGAMFTSQCFTACDSSWVTYYAEVALGSQIQWSVTGAINYQDYGDSIAVHWGKAGSGTITLTETSTNGCIGVAEQCVTIVKKPKAVIGTNATPYFPGLGVTFACRNGDVQFTNASNEDFYVKWDFGDGHVSYEQNPIHSFDLQTNSPNSVYEVKLYVENECYCIDSTSLWINVDTQQVIDINCVGPVCLGDTVEYSSSAIVPVTPGVYSMELSYHLLINNP